MEFSIQTKTILDIRHRADLIAQCRNMFDLRICEVAHALANGERLQPFANFVDPDEFVEIDLDDPRAAVRPQDDEKVAFEPAQSLADRNPTDLEFLCEILPTNAGARGNPSRQYVFAKRVRHPIAQQVGGDAALRILFLCALGPRIFHVP